MNTQIRHTLRAWVWLLAFLGVSSGAWAQSVFINEIHYDNEVTDSGEFIEIAGPAGTDLTSWSLVLYNGNGGAVYNTVSLSGTIPNQSNGFGTVSVSYPPNGIQNGSPDGIALVNNGVLVQFLSYEGSFAGVGGAANGVTSTDIGVSQAGSEPAGTSSLRLTGTGSTYSSFTWTASTSGSTPGSVNTGQTFVAATPTPTLTANPTSLTGLTYVAGAGPATAPVSVSGTNFTVASGNVTVTSSNPAQFTVSPASATFSLSALSATNFTVGLVSGLAVGTAYSATITFAGGGATAVVPVSGTVTATAPAPNLTINDVTVAEGNAGTTIASFTVTLSAPAPVGGVTFDIATADGTATTANSDYVARSLNGQNIPAGNSTFTFDVTVNGDATSEPTESFSVVVSNVVRANLMDGVGIGTITNDDLAPATLISQIQGSGTTFAASFGGTQTIEGIVIRKFTGLTGFYVQEEDADSDSDPATSEGIFVSDQSGFFTGNQGDKVRVTGAVSELTSSGSTLTRITLTSAANVSIHATAQTLPTITNVQLPVANVSDLERYEGMLVNVSAASGNLTVTEFFQLGRFGQVVLSATSTNNQTGTDARLDQYTQFNAPSVSGYATYLAEDAKRRIYLDDANGGQNPDPVIHARGGNALSASNTLRGGDNVASITGVLDERFEGYRIQTATGVNFTAANPRPATPPVVGGSLKVSGFNVLNYFNDLGSSSTTFTNCNGGSLTLRGAENATEFTRQRDKTIQAIINSGVDVMGLNEMQNNGFGSNSAIQNLVNGLNAIAGANSYTFVNSGCISSDAITVAMIYKPAKVALVGASSAIPASFGTGAFGVVGRRALAQTFRETATGGVFTLVVNHWKSKGSSSGGANDADAGDGQGLSNGTRTRQAQDLIAWLATNPTGTTDPDILIMGDLNAYALESPLTTLTTAGYVNLVPNTTYSYVFDGYTGALDHGLRSASLQSQIAGADKWHINADEPNVLDYNTNFKTANLISSLYAADPFRSSDHDPVIIGLDLTGPIAATLVASTSAVCPGTSVSLSATVANFGASYSYTITNGTNSTTATGLSTSAVTVSLVPTVPGAFTLTVLTSTALTTSAVSGSIAVPTIMLTLTANPSVVAEGTGVTLTASTGFSSYTFAGAGISTTAQTGNTYSIPAATTANSGTFSVTATSAGGCSSTATASVTVTPPVAPTLVVVGNPTLGSNNCDVVLTVTAPAKAFVFEGPAPVADPVTGVVPPRYIYSTVFRTSSNSNTASAPGVMKPGTYTVTIFNDIGQKIFQSQVTVGGASCN